VQSVAFANDQMGISPSMKALSSAGVDLSRSMFYQESERSYFQLHFMDREVTNLSSSGYFNEHTARVRMDFSFQSEMMVIDDDGNWYMEAFQFDLHFEAERVSREWGHVSIDKEDIHQFALGIVRDISRFQASGKEIDGLMLTDEDFQELASLDKGEFLQKIMHLIYMLKMANRLNQKERESVMLAPEREKWIELDSRSERSQSFDFSLEVNKVSAIQSTDDDREHTA
jgi:hypothetical protein